MGLQQSMRFVHMLDTAKVPPARMIAGDCEILKRSRHSEPYLTKSEVRLRPPKITRRLDKQGLRRVPASPEYAGSRKKVYRCYLDETADLWDVISVSAGVRGCQLILAPDDLERVVEARRCPIARS